MNARRRAVAAALLSLALVLELPAPVPHGRPPSVSSSVLRASAMAAPSPLRPHAALPAPKRLVSPPLVHAPTLAELQPVPRPHDGGGLRRDLPVPVVAHDSRHAPPDPHAILTPSAQRVAPGRAPSTGVRQGTLPTPPNVRRATSVVGGSGCNATPSSAPSLVLADQGTGINPWWRFVEGPIPGVGRYYVNVATQNFMIKADDMDVHNAGIDLAFRRTANSLSRHDVNGTDGATPTTMGNAWTSTFDAHLAGNASGGLTVSDIDGARYDYSGDGQGHWTSSTPGQYATLTTADGGATYQWTKKSGSAYLFAGPFVNNGNSYEGYNGRLLKIYGRNRNTFINLTYYWVCGDAASNANLAEIDASTQAGVTAKLYFGSFAGHQLLSRLVWPDGKTTVTYNYTAGGVLINVQKPGPNDSGAMANEVYVLAAGHTMIESPRYVASNGAEGGYLNVSTSATTRQFLGLQSVGVMNFTPSDSTNAPLQSGVSTSQMQYNWMALSNVSSGLNQVSDTDGHNSYYYFDASNRVTEVTEWTGAQWLATFYGWDAANNLVADVDARGYETDYAYDGSGNTVAMAAPMTNIVTSTGMSTGRPTELFSYDSYNNVIAVCDQTWSHANGRDWNVTGPPGPSDSLCPQTAGSQTAPGPIVYQYAYPSEEPFGQLATATSQLGYARSYSYPTGNSDYGLPVAISGTRFMQTDATAFQEAKSFGYDAYGNLTTYGTGNGSWSLAYDALGRLTSASDPDGVTTRTCYYPDGATKAKQTALQFALDGVACGSNSVTYTYDADGNVNTETHHFGNTAGTTTKWYDGADRLIEVAQPHDASDYVTYAWLTRYMYDLSQGGTSGSAPTIGSTTVAGHGNLVKTMEYMPPTATGQPTNPTGTPQWIDIRGNAFDALDRSIASYETAFGTAPKEADQYDTGGQLGLLSQKSSATGQVDTLTYDPLGRKVTDTYSGDNGLTPNRSFGYDPAGHVASITASDLGTQQYGYDAEGREVRMTEPTGGNVDSPATVNYSYYPNGTRQQTSIASAAFQLPVALAYSYRPDVKLQTQSFSSQARTYSFGMSYTPAGRLLKRTDPLTGGYVPGYSGNSDNGTPYTLPATTFVPQSYQYDANGNLNGLTIPRGGSYTAFSRDPEAEVTSFNAYSIPSSGYNGATESIAYTNRGEVLQDSIVCASSTTCTTPTIKNSYFNGFPLKDLFTADLRSGQAYGNTNESQQGIDFKYDSAGRLTGSVSRYTTSNTFSTGFAVVPYLRTYDAENHMRTQTVDGGSGAQYVTSFAPCLGGSAQTPAGIYPTRMTFSYWPDGHAASIFDSNDASSGTAGPYTWHWDGDTLLYISTANGSGGHNASAYLGTDAVFSMLSGAPPSSVQVYDRDWTDTAVSSHSLASGTYSYGSWTGQGPPASISCRTGNAAKLYPVSHDNDSVIATEAAAGRADGYIADVITLQGVRSYDPNAAQWTTPDAYAGDVHDPMSQKPFMWNRNNAYDYSDPSGYMSTTTARADSMFDPLYSFGAVLAATGPSILDFASDSHPVEIAGRGKPSGKQKPPWWQELFRGEERADRPPPGSKPINITKYSKYHREIKKDARSSATDHTSISPAGEVWARNPDGTWTNLGPVESFMHTKK